MIHVSNGLAEQQGHSANLQTPTRVTPVRRLSRAFQALKFLSGIHTPLTPPHLCNYLSIGLIFFSKAVGYTSEDTISENYSEESPQISFEMPPNLSSTAVTLIRRFAWMSSSQDV